MKIGRNDPCHCGSGQKYKKCCNAKDDAARSAELAAQAAERAATAAAAAAEAEAASEEDKSASGAAPKAARPAPSAQAKPKVHSPASAVVRRRASV